MAVPETLVAAYRTAHYVVFAEPELVLRIGEPSPGLDALFKAHGVGFGSFVTAANPGGARRSDEANRRADAGLFAGLENAGYICFRGEGRDPKGEWPPEPSVLVLAMTREEASDAGRRLEQNAIVFIEKGKAPELVLLA